MALPEKTRQSSTRSMYGDHANRQATQYQDCGIARRDSCNRGPGTMFLGHGFSVNHIEMKSRDTNNLANNWHYIIITHVITRPTSTLPVNL